MQDPKGSIKDFNVYPKISWKLLLVLGEGEDSGTEEWHGQIYIFGKIALGGAWGMN